MLKINDKLYSKQAIPHSLIIDIELRHVCITNALFLSSLELTHVSGVLIKLFEQCSMSKTLPGPQPVAASRFGDFRSAISGVIHGR